MPSAPCSEDNQSQSKLVWGLPDQRGGGSPAQSPHLGGLKSRLRMCVRACVCYRRNAKLQPSCLFLSLLPLGEGLLAWCLQAELSVLMGEAGGPSPSIRAVPLRPPAFYRSFPRTEPFRVGAEPAQAMGPSPVTYWPCGWALGPHSPCPGRAVGSIPERGAEEGRGHATEGSVVAGLGGRAPSACLETLPGCRWLLVS